jgi:hypothetical protein
MGVSNSIGSALPVHLIMHGMMFTDLLNVGAYVGPRMPVYLQEELDRARWPLAAVVLENGLTHFADMEPPVHPSRYEEDRGLILS